VFVSSGVKHHFRLVPPEHLFNPPAVLDAFDEYSKGYVRSRLKLHLYVVKVVLAVVQQKEDLRFEFRDLPSQFGTD